MPHHVLIIEREGAPTASSVRDALAPVGTFDCRQLVWDALRPQELGRSGEALIIAVVQAQGPRVSGLFEWLRCHRLTVPSFAVVPADAEDGLLRLVSRTTDDFMFSPIRPPELRHRLSRVLGDPRCELGAVRRRLQEEMGLTMLVGHDPAFVKAVEHIPRFARTDLPVLITGETGTGKELCARALHHVGLRRQNPFIAVDCSALPDQLFENELYGHVRGAFTDAHKDHRGLVALAEGGTLFLDEVDALSMGAQAKLLRFLQEGSYRALGSDCFARADVRIVAASNRNLEARVHAKEFRADLFFRLNVLRIELPPLRDRRGDIELLAYAVLKESRGALAGPPKAFSPAALRALALHDWPGNVRELCNVVQRAAVACDGEWILPSQLGLPNDGVSTCATGKGSFRSERAAALETFERRYVEDLLRRHRGNVTHAAREAQQDRRAFGRLIKKHRIDRRALIA